jgi:hypothetical protein
MKQHLLKLRNSVAKLLFGFNADDIGEMPCIENIDSIKADVDELTDRLDGFDPSDYCFDPLNDYDFDSMMNEDNVSEIVTEMLNDREADNADILNAKFTALEDAISELKTQLNKKSKKKKKTK